MSSFKVEVVKLGSIDKHPNADSLGLTKIYNFPVITRLGEFKEGDLAIYIPVDSVVPNKTDPRFSFLEKSRIKAKRLRGIFSCGLLIPAAPEMTAGQDVTEALGIVKYEEPEKATPFLGGDCISDPGIPKYTDIENLRRYKGTFTEGEEVIATEKVHGTNFRAGWFNGEFYVGSHKTFKKEDPNNLYWKAANSLNLKELLRPHPGLILFGEIYGWVQDLRYGMQKDQFRVAFFDALDLNSRNYANYAVLELVLKGLGLPTVPHLYHGPYNPAELFKIAEENSLLGPNIREGLVIRPAVERFSFELNGRCIAKYLSENYLTRKDGTEFH